MNKTIRKQMEGISPIISAVILIVVVFSIASVVSPWLIDLVTETSNETSSDIDNELKCREAAFDFDTTYGTFGISWSFGTVNNTLGAKIKNTGSTTLHNFSFELTFNDTVIEYYSATSETQRTSANPLKPGNSAFINASLTRDVNDTLTGIKIFNAVCTDVYIYQDV